MFMTSEIMSEMYAAEILGFVATKPAEWVLARAEIAYEAERITRAQLLSVEVAVEAAGAYKREKPRVSFVIGGVRHTCRNLRLV